MQAPIQVRAPAAPDPAARRAALTGRTPLRPAQTPDAGRAGARAGSGSGSGAAAAASSWLADLDAYIATHEPGDAERRELVARVKGAPQSAAAWRALLAHEEACGNATQHGLAPPADPGRVSLYHMYYWATQLVPRSSTAQHKEAYLQLWLGFARQQWSRSPDDARDTLKTLKNQHIGGDSAALYHAWASLEHAAGNISRALGVLARGIKAGAQPASLLEQLRGEMQSGTFDLKAAGAFTETLTIDASSMAARQLQQQHGAAALSTPAPTGGAGVRPLGVTAPRAGPPGVASCLKGSAAAPGPAHEHAGRAVTFAADVHSGGRDEHGRRPASAVAAGSASAASSRSVARSGEGHSGCLSSSSTSSRSSASVHDGAYLPFAGSAPSYKSSTTESSAMGGAEEDTITCRAGAAPPAGPTSKASAAKPSTAPLSGSSLTPGAGLGSNTATLGLKRFGFKSRALRVGGASDAAAAPAEPGAAAGGAPASSMPPPAARAAPAGAQPDGQAGAAPPAAVAAGDAADDGALGRKRRAGQGGTPSPKTSPKLTATCKDGQQVRARPEELARGGAAHAAAPAAGAEESSDGDSVPLVSSKLAARLAPDRGTPQGAPRQRPAWREPSGDWTPPAEGQLPSSLESTPEFAPFGGGTGSAGAARQGGAPPRAQQQPTGAAPREGEGEGEEEQTMPTVVLSEAAARGQHNGGAQRAEQARQQPPAQPPAHRPASNAAAAGAGAAPGAREPLRPLQAQGHAGAAAQHARPHGSGAPAKQQQAAPPAAVETGQQPGVARAPPQQQAPQPHHQPAPAPPQPQRGQPEQAPAQAQRGQPEQAPAQAPPAQAGVRQLRPREDAQTVYVQGVRYTKLECVGRGGSSKVFKVMGPGCKIYALKRIRLAGRDAEAASGFIDEINLLTCLRNKPNIIQLVDSQARRRNRVPAPPVFPEEGLIYMVQEYGEIDLARLLAKHDAPRRAAAAGGGGAPGAAGALLSEALDENFIRLYWQQMLQAVAGVHEQRIVHSDLKPANFLLVEGQLKLIDFGIAKAISGDTTSIARESQARPARTGPRPRCATNILGGPAMRVGRPSDVWSLGCILYQMVYGRTPFAELPFLPKMHAICSPGHAVAYPPLANADLADVMRRCLDRDPKTRITLQELLDHPFLHPNRRPAAAPPGGGLSEEQMKALVAQVAAAGAAGVADIDQLTRDLMAKLGAPSAPGGGAAHGGGGDAAGGDRHDRSGRARRPALAPAADGRHH
ncbi:MPS1 [Scenedesmus sp. PABB004]|nr:MPS1 [Scenedesmus sp. PABB004]